MAEQSPAPQTPKKPSKPVVVKVLLGLMIAVGGFNLFDAVGYVFLMVTVSNPAQVPGGDALASLAAFFAAGTFLASVAFFVLFVGIWKGKKLAWSAAVFFSIICLMISLIMVAISGAAVLLMYGGILFCLTQKEVKAFCGKTPKQTQPAATPEQAPQDQATPDRH